MTTLARCHVSRDDAADADELIADYEATDYPTRRVPGERPRHRKELSESEENRRRRVLEDLAIRFLMTKGKIRAPGLSLADVVRIVGLPKSTVHRRFQRIQEQLRRGEQQEATYGEAI